MSFGTDLKQLLRICHLKLSTVASFLGYDASYISKWLSSSKLPSESNIDAIAGKIALLCSQQTQGKLYAHVCEWRGLPPAADKQQLISSVSEFLLASYWDEKGLSRKAALAKHAVTQLDPPKLKRNADLEYSVLQTGFNNRAGNGPMPVLCNSASFLAISEDPRCMDALENERVDLHIFYDPAQYGACVEFCRLLNAACLIQETADAVLYELPLKETDAAAPFCIADDSAMLIQAHDPLGNGCPVLVTDKDIVSKRRLTVMDAISRYALETYAPTDDEYQRYLYKTFLSEPSANFCLFSEMMFSSQDFMFLEDIRSLCANNGIVLESIQQVYRNNNAIDPQYIYYESTIIDFCRTGKWRVSAGHPQHLTLSRAQRKELLRYLLSSSDCEASGSVFRILRDNNPILPRKAFSISVSLTSQLACIMRRDSDRVIYLRSVPSVSWFSSLHKQLGQLSDQYLLSLEESRKYLQQAINSIDA